MLIEGGIWSDDVVVCGGLCVDVVECCYDLGCNEVVVFVFLGVWWVELVVEVLLVLELEFVEVVIGVGEWCLFFFDIEVFGGDEVF